MGMHIKKGGHKKMSKHTYDANGVDPLTGFSLIAEGEYRLLITEVEESLSKSGRDMVNVTCEVVGGSFAGQKVWHRITCIPKGEKGAGFMLHFLHAIGEPYVGVFEWDPDQWVGKMFAAKIVHEVGTDGVTRAKVGTILIEQTADEKKKQTADDEVPF
jgi:hypothetical protein